ncbi:cryptochrome/photolyase family protein [Kushneria phosphatilytica]|uniref:Cryptochrome/photolyase family protein n=1 Tax=Kushneria phosphatilytica TaxID=657387 RepID=A0A1S1NZU9_9GAMM|nr:cryptochrome/photolyase family protein [Kushneria phosphatilytica]OHV12718.1 cryptochrome/photolyase family protein [Kushneria phosphatilytica]QEL10561.1 cryptochrome/photolyase family protein [Kushneria phosphatilytica]
MSRPLILILADQLSFDLPLLRDPPSNAVLALCEVDGEGRYVPHHPQKIVLLFSAMRHFAEALRNRGYQVHYSGLEDADNCQDLLDEAERLARLYHCSEIHVTRPGDWRLHERISQRRDHTPQWHLTEDDRFFCSPDEFARWAGNRRQLRMEHFYRNMRRESGILMENDEPAGGQWNFDHDNREALPNKLDVPDPPRHQPDATTREVMALVERHFSDHFGTLKGFNWAVTRRQALSDLRHFIRHLLIDFGRYQDAISDHEPFLFHSRLSASLNTGLLSPREVCQAAERAWQEGHAPINAVEGFIRQILGWREFVRGVYWSRMPNYKRENRLRAERGLPDFYWSGDTRMRCLNRAITMTHDNAYAHHIQRLMVTGNFALLCGVKPEALCDWYLAVYADAHEWVELPNTLGMVLHADGGYLGSKPYCASGKYIDRMSDHCRHCHYDVKQTTGDNACPFNSLYWDFLERHERELAKNHRMKLIYGSLHRMSDERRRAQRDKARQILEEIHFEPAYGQGDHLAGYRS